MVNLFKGKRSASPSVAEEAEVGGDILIGEEGDDQEDAPEWLSQAIEQGSVTMPDDEPSLDVPHKDVGQDKPFKF